MAEVSSGNDQAVELDSKRHLSPEESLAVLDAQGAEAARVLRVNPVPILGAWGAAWLIGFGAIYLASSKGPGPILTTSAAGVILGVLFANAIVVSVVQAVLHSRGIEGPSRQISAMYGWSWLLGLAGLYGVNVGLSYEGLPAGLAPLVWSGSSLLVVGVLYLAGGMLWKDRVQFGLGAWTLVVGAASVSAGVPANFAVLSLAGGLGFLLAASASWLRRRHSRNRAVRP